MKNIILFLGGVIVLLVSSCAKVEEPTLDNPIDPENPNVEAIQPNAAITSGIGSVINQANITITWEGAGENSQFAYYLDGFEDGFSDWTYQTSVSYNYLDEGDYTFYVKEKTDTKEQTSPTQKGFEVDAVQQSALLFNNWYNSVNANSESYTDLWIEEMSNFLGFSTIITLNGSITITRIEAINNTLGNIALITPTAAEMQSMTSIPIDVVLLEQNSYSGNAPVARVYYKTLTNGDLFINQNSVVRDYNNNTMSGITVRGAKINVN